MLVLSCKECNYICNAMHYQQNFDYWTSDNNDIDKFIQNTQLSAHNDASKALEWIPYNRFYDIKYITGDNVNKVYRANWTDGHIVRWDNNDQNWKRNNQNMVVNLKSLNNPTNITLE